MNLNLSKDQIVTIAVATVVVGTGAAVILQDRQLKKTLQQNLQETTNLVKRLSEIEKTVLEDTDSLQKTREQLTEVNTRITNAMLAMAESGKEVTT